MWGGAGRPRGPRGERARLITWMIVPQFPPRQMGLQRLATHIDGAYVQAPVHRKERNRTAPAPRAYVPGRRGSSVNQVNTWMSGKARRWETAKMTRDGVWVVCLLGGTPVLEREGREQQNWAKGEAEPRCEPDVRATLRGHDLGRGRPGGGGS